MTPLELQARVEQLERERRDAQKAVEVWGRQLAARVSELERERDGWKLRAEKAERERDEALAELEAAEATFDDEQVAHAETLAERAALREQLRVAREALAAMLVAWDKWVGKDLLRPDGKPSTVQLARAALAATEEKRPLPPGVVRSEGFDGQPEVLRETRAATEEKP